MKWRTECFKQFGSVLDLPVLSSYDALSELIGAGAKALDVGCGAHKPFRRLVEDCGGEYFTLDIDTAGDFDYRTFDDVPQETFFDVIIANQILEHVTVQEALEMMAAAVTHLKPGGAVFATVPNTAHPVRQRDCTHITPWPHNDLYSLLRTCGLDVTLMGRFNKHPLTSNPLKRWIIAVICKEFRIDWCDGIVIVGVKR
jgi:hypothetical protein